MSNSFPLTTAIVKFDAETGLIDKAIDGLKSRIGVVGLAATAVVGSLTAAGIASANRSRDIEREATQANLTTDTYQRLTHQFEQLGLTQEDVIGTTDALAGRLYESNEQGSVGNLVFKELNVQTHDLNGNLRNQEMLLIETFKALQNVENETRRVALADELWGGAGTRVLPILRQTNDEFDRMFANAGRNIISPESLASGREQAMIMTEINQTIRAITHDLGTLTYPVLRAIAAVLNPLAAGLRAITGSASGNLTVNNTANFNGGGFGSFSAQNEAFARQWTRAATSGALEATGR